MNVLPKIMIGPLLAAVLFLAACPRPTSENERVSATPEREQSPRTPARRDRRIPEAIDGIVVHVSDGDTFILRDDAGVSYTVRMQGIDAPEKGQAYGDRSKSILTALIRQKRVRVTPTKTDQFKRLVGGVELDGRDVCLELIDRGAVWHFSRFDRELPEGLGETYETAERTARSKRVGLWNDPAPIPPWDFRDRQRDGRPQ